MNCIVVDDDQLTLKTISYSLKQDGYEVLLAEDVSKALSTLENEKIDLIISDVMMPNVSGLGLLSLLKNFYFDKIPVILISSLDKGDVVNNSMIMGAANFFVKPVDLKELSKCVKGILAKPGVESEK